MFLSVDVLSVVSGTIRPGFNTITVLLVFFPVTIVFSSISVLVDSLTVSLISLPLTLIDVSISMNEPALTIGLVSFPEALVHGTIAPDLDAISVSGIVIGVPLSLVLGIVLKRGHRSGLDLSSIRVE